MTHAAPLPSPPEQQSENIKDTVESLVVAFILAFVFRGFLVEAFVIPTGSMAPTLYGKHGTQICPDCGWEYAYGLPDRHQERSRIKCPNCARQSASHQEMPYHTPGLRCPEYERWFDPRLPQTNPALAEQVSHLSFMPQSGDRILVFKWPFDLGGPWWEPQPWDVVVFKNPANGEDNYIKRLIGVPNEVLEIIDGDVYTCRVSDLGTETVDMLHKVVDLKHQQLHSTHSQKWFERQIETWQRKIVAGLDPHLQIRRKTEPAQKSLWHVVYNHDFRPPPGVSLRHRPHWEVQHVVEGQQRWSTSSPTLEFHGLQAERQAVQFVGKPIVDFYAYNFGVRTREPQEPVGDLRLRLVLEYRGGDGTFGISLSKRGDVFTAEFSPDGEVVLHRTSNRSRSPQILGAARTAPWEPGIPVQIEFANLDYQVYVNVGERLKPLLMTTDEQYAPDTAALRRAVLRSKAQPSEARIHAERLELMLAHVVLERDVYYKNSRRNEYPGWGTTAHPIMLREGEYYVLGDNSPASQDSRLWTRPGDYLLQRGRDYQLGTVPSDQLIGKAFFVYWPSGYRIEWLPVLRGFGVIPNVGKMRWIR